MGFTDILRQFMFISLKSESLPQDLCDNAADFILSRQAADGGFLGFDNTTSIFEAMFAVRVLFLTGRLCGEPAERFADYLSNEIRAIHSIVLEKAAHRVGPPDFLATDFFSQIFSADLLHQTTGIDVFHECGVDCRGAIERGIRALVQEDCGVATSPKSHHSGLYYTTLGSSILQLAGIPLSWLHPKGLDMLARLVCDRQGPNGGYYDFEYDSVCDVRATSSAIWLARNLEIESTFLGADAHHDPERPLCESLIDRAAAAAFFNSRRTPDGGYRANRKTLDSDVQSTFYAILGFGNMANWQMVDFPERDLTVQFVFSLNRENGGFAPRFDAKETTPESTFFGLATLAMLH